MGNNVVDIWSNMNKSKNYAFIDGNNLYLGAKSQGIKLHYGDLRLYLKNRLNADKVFLLAMIQIM